MASNNSKQLDKNIEIGVISTRDEVIDASDMAHIINLKNKRSIILKQRNNGRAAIIKFTSDDENI
jgi:hypothetical protein